MKKIGAMIFILAISICSVFAMTSPQELACQQSCKETKKKCEAKASGNMAKKAACEASYNECLKKCKK